MKELITSPAANAIDPTEPTAQDPQETAEVAQSGERYSYQLVSPVCVQKEKR